MIGDILVLLTYLNLIKLFEELTAKIKKSENKETTLKEALEKINDIYIDVEKQKKLKKNH